jgi:hypothetical protein
MRKSLVTCDRCHFPIESQFDQALMFCSGLQENWRFPPMIDLCHSCLDFLKGWLNDNGATET